MRSGRVREEQRIQDNGWHKANESDIYDNNALTGRLNGRLFSCHSLIMRNSREAFLYPQRRPGNHRTGPFEIIYLVIIFRLLYTVMVAN